MARVGRVDAAMTHLLAITIFSPFLAALVVLALPQRAKYAIRIASLLGALVPCEIGRASCRERV